MATARRTKSALKPRSGNSRFQDTSDLLSVGILVGAVLVILITGAAFKIDTPAVIQEPAPQQALPENGSSVMESQTAGTTIPSTPPAQADVESRVSPEQDTPTMERTDVSQRAISDVDRLIASSGGWTLQFMTTRLTESAESILHQLGDDPRLYILPHSIDGEPHYRICWGDFTSRAAAVSTTEIPAALRALTVEPIPRNVGDLVR
jgi:septal ring-binding cell division protein DamX